MVEFLPQRVFDRFVTKYDGNKYVKHFTCWNQLLSMIFGQLSSRDSLRDLIIVIEAHQSKSYHLGFGKSVTRSNLSKANENRNYKIFEDFANHLILIAQEKNHNDSFEIKGNIYAFDSSTIDLCLSVFSLQQVLMCSASEGTPRTALATSALCVAVHNALCSHTRRRGCTLSAGAAA